MQVRTRIHLARIGVAGQQQVYLDHSIGRCSIHLDSLAGAHHNIRHHVGMDC